MSEIYVCSAMRLQIRSVDVPTITRQLQHTERETQSEPKISWGIKDNPKYTQGYPWVYLGYPLKQSHHITQS